MLPDTQQGAPASDLASSHSGSWERDDALMYGSGAPAAMGSHHEMQQHHPHEGHHRYSRHEHPYTMQRQGPPPGFHGRPSGYSGASQNGSHMYYPPQQQRGHTPYGMMHQQRHPPSHQYYHPPQQNYYVPPPPPPDAGMEYHHERGFSAFHRPTSQNSGRSSTVTPSSQMAVMSLGDRRPPSLEYQYPPPPPPPPHPFNSSHHHSFKHSYHHPGDRDSRSPSPSGIPPPPKLKTSMSAPPKLKAPVPTRLNHEDNNNNNNNLLGPLRESRRLNRELTLAAPKAAESAMTEQLQMQQEPAAAPPAGNIKAVVSVQDASLLLGLRASSNNPSPSTVPGLSEDEKTFASESVIPPPPPPLHYPPRVPKNFPTRLALPGDNAMLNSLHCYIRTHLLEIFVVEKTRNKSPSHAASSALGRVGLRCVHCALARKRATVEDKNEAPMAVFYPKSISEIYRLVTSWQRCHLRKCRSLPPAVRTEWESLRESDKTRGKTHYWTSSAKSLGLVDCPSRAGGVRFDLPDEDYMTHADDDNTTIASMKTEEPPPQRKEVANLDGLDSTRMTAETMLHAEDTMITEESGAV